MSSTYGKVKSISEDLGLSEAQVGAVLYDYLTWCVQEMLISGESTTIFGKIKLDDKCKLELVNNKFGLIELLGKKDIKLIRKIVEDGPDYKIF